MNFIKVVILIVKIQLIRFHEVTSDKTIVVVCLAKVVHLQETLRFALHFYFRFSIHQYGEARSTNCTSLCSQPERVLVGNRISRVILRHVSALGD